jgi:hypothetical protein
MVARGGYQITKECNTFLMNVLPRANRTNRGARDRTKVPKGGVGLGFDRRIVV